MDHECTHQDSGGAVPWDPQRQHGDHRCAAGAIVGGLGGGHTLDLAVAKSLGMAGGLLHLVIRDERRQTTASSRGCADNDADQGAMPIGLRHRRYSSFVILSLVMAED